MCILIDETWPVPSADIILIDSEENEQMTRHLKDISPKDIEIALDNKLLCGILSRICDFRVEYVALYTDDMVHSFLLQTLLYLRS